MIEFVKELWLVYTERAKARKAVRLLTKQAWSVEFLTWLLSKANDMSKRNVHMVLRNPDGQELIIIAENTNIKDVNTFKRHEHELDIRQQGLTWEAVRDAAEMEGLL